jgi:phosphocarrier protein FPr
MVGIVLISHSYELAQGLLYMTQQVVHDRIEIAAAGGVDEYTVGTNAERIYAAIEQVYSADGVLILYDLGSALLSTQLALEMAPLEWQQNILVSTAPFVEGAIIAAVEASLERSLGAVNAAAEAALDNKKGSL